MMSERLQYQNYADLQAILAANPGMKIILSECLSTGNFVTLVEDEDIGTGTQTDQAAMQIAIKTALGKIVKNVLDYGAIGDGVVSDSAAINAAINAASQKGGAVFFPSGTYRITQTIMLKDNVTLDFDSNAKIKLMNQFVTTLTADHTLGDNKLTCADVSGFEVGQPITYGTGSTGYCDGSRAYIAAINGKILTLGYAEYDQATDKSWPAANSYVATALVGIQISNAANCKIQGGEIDGNKENTPLWTYNFDNLFNGITIFSASNIQITGTKVHGFRFQGIHPWGDIPDFVVEDCVTYDCSDGICIDSLISGEVRDCTGYGNQRSGILVTCSDNIKLTGGHYYNNDTGVIVFSAYDNTRVSLSGVDCHGNNTGLSSTDMRALTVNDANLKDNINSGVQLSNVKNSVFKMINITNSAAGVQEDSKCENNSYSGLRFNLVNSKYILNGAGSELDGNSANFLDLPLNQPALFSGFSDISIAGEKSKYYLSDVLNGAGNITAHAAEYTKHGFYGGCLNIWQDNYLNTVDGFACLDGEFSDFASVSNPRSSYLLFPAAAGHYYVVAVKAKGQFRFAEYNYNTSVLIQQTDLANTTDWEQHTFLIDGDGKNQIFCCLRTGYTQTGLGYFKDVVVVSVDKTTVPGYSTPQILGLFSNITARDSYGNIAMSIAKNAGDITENKALYNKAGIYNGTFGVWKDGLVASVDNYDCIDGVFNDFQSTTIPRSNFIQFPAVGTRYYVVFVMQKGQFRFAEYNYETGALVGQTDMVTSAGWTQQADIIDGAGKSQIFCCLRTGYQQMGLGYFKDVSVVSIDKSTVAGLTNAQIIALCSQHKSANTGDINENKVLYNTAGFYNGCVGIWQDGLVTTVDGYECLDGIFSDFTDHNTPRANYLQFPSNNDYYFLVVLTSKGVLKFTEYNYDTGAVVQSTDQFTNASWTRKAFLIDGSGKTHIFCCLCAGYTTKGSGYYRDIMVLAVAKNSVVGMTNQQILDMAAGASGLDPRNILRPYDISDLSTGSYYIGSSNGKNLLENNLNPKLLEYDSFTLNLKDSGSNTLKSATIPAMKADIYPSFTVSDEISFPNLLTKRIGSYTLTANDISVLDNSGTYDIVTIGACLNGARTFQNALGRTVIVPNMNCVVQSSAAANTYYENKDQTFCLVFAKGTYPALSDAKAGLAGTIVNYILAQPSVSYVDGLPLYIGQGDSIDAPGGTQIPDITVSIPGNPAAAGELNAKALLSIIGRL